MLCLRVGRLLRWCGCRLPGYTPLPAVLRKIFKTLEIGSDLGSESVKKSYFRRTFCAKSSKERTLRAWAGPGGVVL